MDRTYILIGCGGTGTHFVAPALAFLDSWHRNDKSEYEFIVIDGDAYEAKNLERQRFDPRFVGINKAKAVAEMYNQYPINAIDTFVGEKDLQDIMVENSVVFLGVDNFSVRALVQERALQLKNITIINGGNEYHDGMVQLWVREKGKNKTPPLTFLHPEISYLAADDRSAMTCAQAAELPGGEQLVIANMAVAVNMVTALWRFVTGDWKTGWTEMNFDLKKGEAVHIDYRTIPNWEKDRKPVRVETKHATAT